MAIAPHNVQRGTVLGVHRLPFHVQNVATGNVYLPIFGRYRIVGAVIVPQVDQSAFTGCTARLYATDGTTPITAAVAVDIADGAQAAVYLGGMTNNNDVNAESLPLVLTITNPGSDTLDMQIMLLLSEPLTADAGAYTDYVPADPSNGQPII